MQVTREDLNPCTVKLEIVCDPEQVKEGFDKAVKRISKNVRIPGFRPGHAPKNLVENAIDPDALAEEAAEKIVQNAYKKAIEEEKLEPYSKGAVELKEFSREELKCEFTAKVPLKPIVEVGDYSNLTVDKPSSEVTDEDIDQQLEEMRGKHTTREAVTDRGLQESDVALLNIKADGEEGDGRNFMIIAGQTFPELDALISGMNVEEMKAADLTFPASFQEKDWAGKTMHCQITLRSLSSVKLPELDDEFAKNYSLDNMDVMRERLKDIIKSTRENAVAEYVNEQILNQLLERSKVEVPDTMWESVVQQKLEDLARDLSEKKKTIEEYAKENGMELEQFIEAQKQEAKTYVLRAQLIQEIFQKEDMKLTDVELNRELNIMARDFRMEPKELLETLRKNGALQEITFQALNRKVMDFLNERAEAKETVSV